MLNQAVLIYAWRCMSRNLYLLDKVDFCMTQDEIASEIFVNQKTVSYTEKNAIEKFKQELFKRNINAKDLLED